MNTRQFVLSSLALVATCVALPAWPQQPVRLPKVAILSPARQADMACLPNNQGGGAGCLLEGLRALGYSDGRNVAFETRFAEGAAERLPALAAELVALRPDVIYTYTTVGANAAAAATTTIPIVVGPAGEAAMERLAGNFARPVGNVTGLTLMSVGQDEKCLQLLKELAPRIARVAVLANPDNPAYGGYLDLLRPAATQLGITLTRIEARNAAELPQAFTAIRAGRADAILILDDVALAGTTEVRRQIIQWALGQRPLDDLPAHLGRTCKRNVVEYQDRIGTAGPDRGERLRQLGHVARANSGQRDAQLAGRRAQEPPVADKARVVRVAQHRHAHDTRRQLLEQLQ